MFPQFKKINNESGIVLFFVLMTAIIIMVFSLGILTQSMNEINYAQQQIDQLVAEQWSKGVIWNAISANSLANSVSTTQPSGRNLTLTTTASAPNPLTGQITWNATTSYDSD